MASVCYGDSQVAKYFNSESVSATKISLTASSSHLIFFPAIAQTPRMVRLIYTPLYDRADLQ